MEAFLLTLYYSSVIYYSTRGYLVCDFILKGSCSDDFMMCVLVFAPFKLFRKLTRQLLLCMSLQCMCVSITVSTVYVVNCCEQSCPHTVM